jgi:hypothetical protein
MRIPDSSQTGSMAGLLDLTECWRSRNRGRRERHGNGMVLAQQARLDGRGRNDLGESGWFESGGGHAKP